MKILTTTIFSLLIAALAYSQSIELTYGQSVQGNFSSLTQIDTYRFNAEAGDRIYIRMRDAESPVDACFSLLDPSGAEISVQCGDGGIVMLKNFSIPTSGIYTILASDVNHNDIGGYGISIYKLNSPGYAIPIECGHDGEYELLKTTEVITYTFEALAGDVLKARMRGESSSFESEIEVYDAAGNQLAADYGSGLSFVEGLSLPADGHYTIIGNDRNGNDLGVFGLSIQLVNRKDCAEAMDCGDNLSTAVNTIAGMQAYTFTLESPAPTIAQARSLNGSFETQIQIYDSEGAQVASTTGSSSLQNITTTLAPGDYQLIALDKGGNDKAEFGIALQMLSDEQCGENIFCYDNSSTVEFTTLAAMKAYTFSGEIENTVTPEALGISEHFDPEILVYDRAGNLLASDYSFGVTTLPDVQLTSSGQQYVILRDWHGNDLGAFKFSISSESIFENSAPIPDAEELATVYGDCRVVVSAPTAMDPCDGPITATTDDPLEYNEQGSFLVTWVYENGQGVRVTQDQMVIVEDKKGPAIECNAILNFALSENGEFILEQADLEEIVTDKCSQVAWIEIEQNYFDCSMIGENEITIWTADLAGNESSCSIAINITGENCTAACGDLPDNWKIKDVGAPDGEGTVCYDPAKPTFEVSGYGEDIFGKADQFTFVYQEMCGSSEIIAKISDMSSEEPFALSGIMMRKNTKTGSKYAALLATPDKGVLYQTRLKNDDYTLYEAHEGAPPVWVKLVRIGQMISGYISTDAVNWELNCEIEVKIGECYLIGLAVSSQSESEVNVSTIDYVEINSIGAREDAKEFRLPSTLAMADPCKFEIDERGDKPDCSSTEEEEIEIHVFPNPTADWVHIDGKEFKGASVTISIIDRRGKTFYNNEFKVAPALLPLDIKSLRLKNGYYSVIINDGSKIATQSFLVMDEG